MSKENARPHGRDSVREARKWKHGVVKKGGSSLFEGRLFLSKWAGTYPASSYSKFKMTIVFKGSYVKSFFTQFITRE